MDSYATVIATPQHVEAVLIPEVDLFPDTTSNDRHLALVDHIHGTRLIVSGRRDDVCALARRIADVADQVIA